MNYHKGMVLYTDGGCRPSRGFGGWGLHGYLYTTEPSKKGAGQADNYLTDLGYIRKVEVDDMAQINQVTPIHYVDGFGSYQQEVTNNIAELTSAIQALAHAVNYAEVVDVLILADSEYVLKGITEYMPIWLSNNFTRRDGEPVANQGLWRDFVKVRDQLIQRGVNVRFDWVKGHDPEQRFLGNTIADRLATLGVMASKRQVHFNQLMVSEADGYWKYDAEKHPMLTNRRCYFNTISPKRVPGEYYLGEHGTDDELCGKRMSDGTFSVVRLAQPDQAIEQFFSMTEKMAQGRDALMMIRLEQLFRPMTHKEITNYGEVAVVQPQKQRLDLNDLGDEPVSREFNPPRLALRVVLSMDELAVRLDQYLAGDKAVTVTDLTPILYETVTKSKKVKGGGEEVTHHQVLRPEFVVGYAALAVEANYEVEGVQKTAPVTLTLGIDSPDRNALKRLETMSPKVSLISWLESPTAFRYATVVEAGEDKGIWAGVYSNLRIVS